MKIRRSITVYVIDFITYHMKQGQDIVIMNRIKLVVTDLDSTLLRRNSTISSYTVDILHRLQQGGVVVAFATARDYRFVSNYLSPLYDVSPDIVISNNGALARDKNDVIYRRVIPEDTVNRMLTGFELKRCVSTESTYFYYDRNSKNHWSRGKKDTVITDFKEGIKGDALYIDGIITRQLEEICKEFPMVRIVKYSDVDTVTVVHKEATKLNALIAVEQKLNIQNDEVVAFGDDYSDIEWLSYHENSVAVANAIAEVKDAANYLCHDCDEDGVAKWLEERILRY